MLKRELLEIGLTFVKEIAARDRSDIVEERAARDRSDIVKERAARDRSDIC